MLEYDRLLKGTAAYRSLMQDFNGGKPSHAYLLISRDSRVLSELATLAAMAAGCTAAEKPCGTCRACRNIMEHVHPDVKYLPEKDARLGVEEISAMIADSTLSGMESENKVYVIAHAEKMLPVAQNKLLKTIEEPPRGVTILLCTENEAGILVTIRSRVRQVVLEEFPVETIRQYLVEKYGDSEKAAVVAVCADGLLGRADEMFSRPETYEMYNDMFLLMRDFSDSSQVLGKAVLLAKYKENLTEALGFLLLVLRDALMTKSAPQLVRATHRQDLAAIAALYPQAALIAAMDKVNAAREKLFYNCNVTAVIDKLLFDILEERSKCRLL